MAKTFEFRRHSIKDGPTSAMIGPKGYALARAVGGRHLRGRAFDAHFVSGLFRTQQTLAAFAEGAGDFRLKYGPSMPPLYVERQDVWDLWAACRQAELRGEDMPRAAQAHDHALFHVLAAEYALLFEVWAASFPEGANVLVVGHSPHLEMMAFGLFGTMLTGLRECEGFRVIHAPASRLDHGTPDLDPRLVRQALFP